MEHSTASVQVWQLLVSLGCTQRARARVMASGESVHQVEIYQFGTLVSVGEDPEIRVAALRAMLEAVQLVSTGAGGIQAEPVPARRPQAPA